MNCTRCHHTHRAHVDSQGSESLVRLGRCMIPACTCNQYMDEISRIDEDLL